MKLSYAIWMFGGVIAYVIEMNYIYEMFGTAGLIAGAVIFPAVMIGMPFYIAFAMGNWIPFVLTAACFVRIVIDDRKIDIAFIKANIKKFGLIYSAVLIILTGTFVGLMAH